MYIEPGKRSDKPCIRGIRITVDDILGCFAAEHNQTRGIGRDYLTQDDTRACFAYAADIFPDSAHVDRIGLGGGSNDEAWCYAKDNGFMIVSKDSDFYEKSLLYGHPSK